MTPDQGVYKRSSRIQTVHLTGIRNRFQCHVSRLRTPERQNLLMRLYFRPTERQVNFMDAIVGIRVFRRAFVLLALLMAPPAAHGEGVGMSRFPLPATGLVLDRPIRSGPFFDVVGRRSAAFGYEGHGLEAWVYPLKLLDEMQLSFPLRDYPVEIAGPIVSA